MTTDNPKATEDKTNENCSKTTNLETQEAEIIEVTPLDLDQNSKAFGDKNGDVFEQVTAKYYEATSTLNDNSSTVSPGDNNSESDVRNNTTTGKVTATAESTNDPVTVIPDVIPVDGEEIPASQTQKIKGAAQMAAGGALAVAGVPLLILPGPGAVFIVGGVALASKGQRNFSGRAASPLEAKLDTAAAKMAEIAKEQAKQAAQNAAKEAPHVAKNIAQQIPVAAKKAADTAPVVAKKVADTAPILAQKVADTAPVVAKKISETAPVVAKTIGAKAPKAARKVSESAPIVAEKVSKQAPEIARKVADGAATVANATIKAAPIITDKVAKSAPRAAEKMAQTAPKVADKVIAGAPVVAETVSKGLVKGISLGADLLKQAGNKITESKTDSEHTHSNTLHTK